MVWAGIIIFETWTIWKTMKCKVTILIHDLEIHVANPRTDGRMERKFSHFHISRLLVLFLNDIANILPVLPDWEWTWIAGEISKALRALSSNLLFSQENRMADLIHVWGALGQQSWVWQEKCQSVCTWDVTLGPVSLGQTHSPAGFSEQ